MFNFTAPTVRKQQLVDILRTVQEFDGQKISAASTLQRQRGEELITQIETLCGNKWIVGDTGEVTANPFNDDPTDDEAKALSKSDEALVDEVVADITGGEPPPADGLSVSDEALVDEAEKSIKRLQELRETKPNGEDHEPSPSPYLDPATGNDVQEEAPPPAASVVVPEAKAKKIPEGNLVVITKTNPRREGKGSYARFQMLAESTTVAEYYAKVKAAGGSDREAYRSLHAAITEGHAKVVT